MGAGGAVAPAAEAVAAAVGDPAELLDVHVQQFARSLPDVANRDAGRPVTVTQTGQTMAAQDVADRRARDPDDRGQAVGADAEPMAGAGGRPRRASPSACV